MIFLDKIVYDILFHVMNWFLGWLFGLHDCCWTVIACAVAMLIQKMIMRLFRNFNVLDGVCVNAVLKFFHRYRLFGYCRVALLIWVRCVWIRICMIAIANMLFWIYDGFHYGLNRLMSSYRLWFVMYCFSNFIWFKWWLSLIIIFFVR
jgi:hypothetical protein